jgi:hypothetical protein
MTFVVENWYMIVIMVVVVADLVVAVWKWHNQSSETKQAQIKGWLLQAVTLAEQKYGSGTGQLKLSVVYDQFCERVPWLAKILSFETFSEYVDEALTEMRALLKENAAVASIVSGEWASSSGEEVPDD